METAMTWSKLPKRDKKHLKENGILTMTDFVEQVKFLKEMRLKYPSTSPCYECERIARKLGIWEGDI